MTSPARILRQALCLFLPVTLFAAKPADLAPFQAQAAKANSVLLLPTYPVTPDEVKALAAKAIDTAGIAHKPVMPAPISAGVLGIARTMPLTADTRSRIHAIGTPAAIETTSFPVSAEAVSLSTAGNT